jgi:predicted dehydrogenase
MNFKAMMDTLRFGLIGTNFITDWVIAGARQDKRFRAEAVCSRTPQTAAAFAAKHGIPHTFTSPEEMAQSPLIDAVYIASPNSLHASQSILFMRNGKHVLCEKPFASNLAEAEQMVAEAQANGVTLMEAMKPTLTPNFRSVCDNLGRIGRVRRYFASFCQYSSRYEACRQGVVPNVFSPTFSGGATMDVGVYTIYPMVALFGRPQRVEASGLMLPSGVDAQAAVNFLYDGMNATVIYSKITNSSLPTEIQGEEGNITLDRISIISNVTYTPRTPPARGRGSQPEPQDISAVTGKDEYYYEISEFIDLVLDGRRESAVNSHANSLLTMGIMDDIRRQLGVVFPAD